MGVEVFNLMREFKGTRIAVAVATIASAALALGSPSISSTSVRAYHTAIDEANAGQVGRATATLSCILMPYKLTVGMSSHGSMERAVSRGVGVWSSRLPDAPFVFTGSASPAIKVSFVHGINRGGDIQGEVHCERQVYWGSSGAKYRVRGTILIRDNVDGRPITSIEAASVIEHELGHVLGLEDDSSPDCLMGPFVAGAPVDGPAPQEVYTLSTFRGAVHDALHQIEGRQAILSSRGAGGRGHRRLVRHRS
jgi:hypothetical protein